MWNGSFHMNELSCTFVSCNTETAFWVVTVYQNSCFGIKSTQFNYTIYHIQKQQLLTKVLYKQTQVLDTVLAKKHR